MVLFFIKYKTKAFKKSKACGFTDIYSRVSLGSNKTTVYSCSYAYTSLFKYGKKLCHNYNLVRSSLVGEAVMSVFI